MQNEIELIWNNDGHSISLRIEKNELIVIGFECPNKNEDAACRKYSKECIVESFIYRFGLECNVGACEPSPKIQIAWAITGEPEMGLDLCQVWVIPTADEFFSAWALAQ